MLKIPAHIFSCQYSTFSRREKVPLLYTIRYFVSLFPPLKLKLPSFPLSLSMAWQAEGPDFLPRLSSHFSKVPLDPFLTLGLPPVLFPPTLIGVLIVGLDVKLANSGLVVAPKSIKVVCIKSNQLEDYLLVLQKINGKII